MEATGLAYTPIMDDRAALGSATGNEAEEAQWWYDNRIALARDFVEAVKQVKVKRVTLAVLRQRLADSIKRAS